MSTAASDRATGRRKHRLFGLDLESDFGFASRLAAGRGPADLTFRVAAAAPFGADPGEPVYESPLLDDAGESLSRLYRPGEGELLRFGDALDFYLGSDAIDCHLRRPDGAALVEVRLLGPVLAYWLERLGVCALHASAVVVDGRAVAFMAAHQGGKTALAAALMSAGAPLLTDDLLPVEARDGQIVARPGYPQMRMRSDGLEWFVDRRSRRAVARRLGKFWVPVGHDGHGAFRETAAPLACLYLPQRGDGGSEGSVRISEVSPRQTLIELLRCSFSPYIVEAAGLQPGRLELLASLAESIPVRRLVYPAGFAELPRVARAVLADVAGS